MKAFLMHVRKEGKGACPAAPALRAFLAAKGSPGRRRKLAFGFGQRRRTSPGEPSSLGGAEGESGAYLTRVARYLHSDSCHLERSVKTFFHKSETRMPLLVAQCPGPLTASLLNPSFFSKSRASALIEWILPLKRRLAPEIVALY